MATLSTVELLLFEWSTISIDTLLFRYFNLGNVWFFDYWTALTTQTIKIIIVMLLLRHIQSTYVSQRGRYGEIYNSLAR